jgi:site-specific DNA recombinase
MKAIRHITPAGPAGLSNETSPAYGHQAVIYLRVSTKDQAEKDGDEGYSIPAQRQACRRKAASLDANVLDEFVDAGESARSADRPELQRLLLFIAEYRPDYVIVHKVDRLARNRADDVMINIAIQQAGATLVSCSENIDATPSGELLHGIMASIAQFYSRNLATEALKGMTEKAQRGGTVGKAPLGYQNVGKLLDGREVRTVEIDADRAPHIQWAFEAYATGDWTILKLQRELTERGLKTLGGRKRSSAPLVPSRVHAMLSNRYYVGKVNFRGVEYDGTHPRLVDPETFERVQGILATHRVGEKQREHPHYLKSSVVCGLCGSRMGITGSINRHGTRYLYFFCIGRQQRRSNCNLRSVQVAKVEAQVETEWAKLKLDPSYAMLLQELIQRDFDKLQAANAKTEDRANRALQRKRAERQKLLQAYYTDALDIATFKAEQLCLTKEIESQEVRVVQSRLKLANLETVLHRTLAFLDDPQATYLAGPPAFRRQLNQAIWERFEVYPEGDLAGTHAEPFRTLLDPTLVAGDTVEEEGELWADGMPAWFARHHRYQRRPARRHAKVSAVNGFPVGLKDDSLAPPTGFEPVLPP